MNSNQIIHMHVMKQNSLLALAVGVALAPSVASAQTTVQSIISVISNIIEGVVALLIALAVVYFFWGVAKYILKAGDANARGEAINQMIWGVVGIFVMVSVWGLVRLVQNTFGIQNESDVQQFIPAVPTFGPEANAGGADTSTDSGQQEA